jgi:predicted metal-dependent TIM-barrel fold hydrolase
MDGENTNCRAGTGFVDSHCHLDLVSVCDGTSISWIKESGCLPVSWSYCGRAQRADDLRKYLARQKEAIARLNREGLRCYYLCGIHPRDITPDLTPSLVSELLQPFLDDPLCLGIGEIGLETGSDREKEILSAHLAVAAKAARRGKVAGIHTPRGNKEAVTAQVLEMLEDCRHWRRSIVVDHCTRDTIARVLQMGLWAGITMSPEKTGTRDLAEIVNAHGNNIGSIMLNTDSGASYHRDLWALRRDESIEKSARTALLKDNALSFFGLS